MTEKTEFIFYVAQLTHINEPVTFVKHFNDTCSCKELVLLMKNMRIRVILPADNVIVETINALVEQPQISVLFIYRTKTTRDIIWKQCRDLSIKYPKIRWLIHEQSLKSLLITEIASIYNQQHNGTVFKSCLDQLRQETRVKLHLAG
ncbi:unnamed protein product, partial [Didymodactylos carnosus]